MNKKDIIKLVILLGIVLMFLLSTFGYMGGGFNFGGGGGLGGENVSGTTVFNGTIRTYDPVLVLPADVDQSLIDELRNRDDVKDVRVETDGVVVETETRDDVYPLATYLRSIDVISISVANIILPGRIEQHTASGVLNVTAGTGVVRVITEPLLDVDSEVTVAMTVVSQNNYLVGYSSPSILLQPVSLELDASIEKLNHKVYTYTIPWESRNSLGDLSEYGTVEYDKIDSMVFDPPLTVDQILTKKSFPYVTYIDASSAQVLSDFDNLTQVQSNFQDVSFTLPPSTLKITTNQTPELPFDSAVRYSYTVGVPGNATAYEFEELSFMVDSEKEYDINSTVMLTINGLAVGNRIVSVESLSLPS